MSRRTPRAVHKKQISEKWHTLSINNVVTKLSTGDNGLNSAEAKRRLVRFGPNELIQEKSISRLKIFLSQFRSFLVVILIAATIFSAIIGEVIDSIAILIIIILNAIFGYVQEYKAERTIEALKRLTKPETSVIRDGREIVISSRKVVPGDIVVVGEGSRITADMRLLSISELKIDESSMTGE